jgi:hypothetical protein
LALMVFAMAPSICLKGGEVRNWQNCWKRVLDRVANPTICYDLLETL